MARAVAPLPGMNSKQGAGGQSEAVAPVAKPRNKKEKYESS